MRWRWSRRDPLDRCPRYLGGKLLGSYEKDVGRFIHPDVLKLAGVEQRQWGPRMRKVKASGVPTAGFGFTSPFIPNLEPVANLAAVTGGTVEVQLYNPATASVNGFCLIPQGTLRSGQALRCYAAGVYTSSATTQTAAFTTRIGTSATVATNVTAGATGLISLGNATAVTNGLWVYEAHGTVRAPGASGSIVANTTIEVSNQAAGSVTNSQTGMSGNTVATVDTTIQQGWVISETPSAAGVSLTLTQFMLVAWD